jgi:hypothetical protein
MANFLPPNDPVLKDAWINRAPSQVVAEWLSQVHPSDRRSIFQLFPEGALQKLLARHDSFIDLAIALYGDDPEVLRELWRRDDGALRRAILRNQGRDRGIGDNGLLNFLQEGDALLAFFRAASREDIEALVTNPNLDGTALAAIFKRQGVFAALPLEQWRTIAALALKNPNLHRRWLDEVRPYAVGPGRESEYWSATEQAMRLLLDFPVEPLWASWLLHGYSEFKDLNIPTEPRHDIFEGQDSTKKFTEWREKATREFLEAVFRRWMPDDAAAEDKRTYGFLRMSVAALVPKYDKELRQWVESYPDKWVQVGAARTKHFGTPDEVQEWFDRHGWHFLEYVEENPFLHCRGNPAVVEKVRSLVQFLAGEERAEKDGVDWKDRQHIRSWWMHAANRLHKKAPHRFFAWDDEIEVPEKEDDRPLHNPVVERVDEILSRLRAAKDSMFPAELVTAVSQTIIEMEMSASRRQAELVQTMNDSSANMSELVARVESKLDQILMALREKIDDVDNTSIADALSEVAGDVATLQKFASDDAKRIHGRIADLAEGIAHAQGVASEDKTLTMELVARLESSQVRTRRLLYVVAALVIIILLKIL